MHVALTPTEWEAWQDTRPSLQTDADKILVQHRNWLAQVSSTVRAWSQSAPSTEITLPSYDNSLGKWLHSTVLQLDASIHQTLIDMHVDMHCSWSALLDKVHIRDFREAQFIFKSEFLPLSVSLQHTLQDMVLPRTKFMLQ